jgi:hypothetical protein
VSGGFPPVDGLAAGTSVGSSLSNGGTGIASNAAANTLGSFVQIIASTVGDASWVEVDIFPPTNSANGFAIDLAVGSAGNEVVIADKMHAHSNTSKSGVSIYRFPCAIPAGTRLSARSQATTGSNTGWVALRLFDSSFMGPEDGSGIDSIGFVAASTTGTTVTTGAASTLGSYAQLTASTTVDYSGLILMVDSDSTGDWYIFDIAIGAGGSEQVIIPRLATNPGLSTDAGRPAVLGPWPVCIPAGSRLAVRAAAVASAAATVHATLYGIK